MAVKSYLLYGTVILSAVPSLTQEKFDIADSLNKFTIDLLAATNNKANGNNVALSSFTIWTLLSVISEGALDNTADQLERVLRLPENKNVVREAYKRFSESLVLKSAGAEFDTTNGMFVNQGIRIKEKFRNIVKQFYNSSLQEINFANTNQAANIINQYIEEATRFRIKDLVFPNDLINAQFFLTTAVYFKGEWKVPFNKSATQSTSFYDEKKNKIGNVDMMYQTYNYPFGRIDRLKVFALELPYGFDNQYSMLILLPRSSQTIEDLLNQLKKDSITDILTTLKKNSETYDDDVHVYLPKFKISSDYFLDSVLYQLGVKDIFDSQKVNLLGMFQHYYYVSRFIQKAEIELDEEGTVASAAGGSIFINRSPAPRFMANKPFLYFIVHKKTGAALFAGKVSNPNTFG